MAFWSKFKRVIAKPKILLRVSLRVFITYGAKLLNADWLRQRAFFLNHEGTFW